MHSPPKEYNSVRINSESPTEAFDIVDFLRRDIVVIFNIALPLARFLFSITLLDFSSSRFDSSRPDRIIVRNSSSSCAARASTVRSACSGRATSFAGARAR